MNKMNNKIEMIAVVDVSDLNLSEKCGDYLSDWFEISNGSYHRFDMTCDDRLKPEYYTELMEALKALDITPQTILLHFSW